MNADASPLCKFLEWDSDFFGMRIARVLPRTLTQADANAARHWLNQHQIDIAYALFDADDAESAQPLHHVGFRYVDTRLTLEIRRLPPVDQLASDARIIELSRTPNPQSLIPILQAIARVSHTDTRFYFDRRFPRTRCDELYARWLVRDWERGTLFVAEHDGQPAGYITCTVDGEVGEIGLLGVAESAQGQGLGAALIRQALVHFAEHGCTRTRVVTQGRNVRAQRAYLRAGFMPMQAEVWWHG